MSQHRNDEFMTIFGDDGVARSIVPFERNQVETRGRWWGNGHDDVARVGAARVGAFQGFADSELLS